MTKPTRSRQRPANSGMANVSTEHLRSGEKLSSTEKDVPAVWGDVACATPAYVEISLGVTRNLGNYESLRVQATVTLPCLPTEEAIVQAKGDAATLATNFIDEEQQFFGSPARPQ